jgi:hypothetical protein
MMELLFLFCWTSVFIVSFCLTYLKFISRFRTYLLLVLNLIFLSGIFYFYPISNNSVSLEKSSLNSEEMALTICKFNPIQMAMFDIKS